MNNPEEDDRWSAWEPGSSQEAESQSFEAVTGADGCVDLRVDHVEVHWAPLAELRVERWPVWRLRVTFSPLAVRVEALPRLFLNL